MDQGPLVIEGIEAGTRFLGEFEKKFPVAAAFWLKVGEEDYWHLYAASDRFDGEGLKSAYGEVGRIINEMRDPNFDPFRVKLITAGHPLAKAAIGYLQLYPGRMATKLRRRVFGGIGVDEVYIYPKPVTIS